MTKPSLRLIVLLLPFAIVLEAQYGPKIEPLAMSSSYNPLLWRGDDAKFAVDTMLSSYCASEISKAVAAKTANPAVQNVALTAAYDRGRVFKKLRDMARTFNFPLPAKQKLQECAGTARLNELEGQDLDSAYLSFLKKTSAENVARFEGEVQLPRGPSNWSLWAFAEKNLPIIREDAAAIANTEQSATASK